MTNTSDPLRLARLLHCTAQRQLALLRAAAAACWRTLRLAALGVVVAVPALAQNITTVAGNGSCGYPGDGIQATLAALCIPFDVAVDAAGNLYIADTVNHRIRKVDSAGLVSTVAGLGASGYSGDGGPATSARLHDPRGVAVDASGNLYIADYRNHRIRMVNSSGDITTVVGTGSDGYTGDGGPATTAMLNHPVGLALDAVGNLYIADSLNYVIRKVDSAGDISTVAGSGVGAYSGDGGPATQAGLAFPSRVAVDAAGNLYITTSVDGRVRKVDSAGDISTMAGNGQTGFGGDGAQATAARLMGPHGVAVDVSGNVYIADMSGHRIRMVDSSGVISTVAGNGTFGDSGDGAQATSARLSNPSGIALDAAGHLYIADSGNHRIRKVMAVPPAAATAAAAVAGNAQATVSWTAPSSNGGRPITGYTAAAVQDPTKTCSPMPAADTSCTVTGLTNGTGYTFTVVASNSVGPGTASVASTMVTPVGPPGAPTSVTALAGNAQATVSWTAPASNGGSTITSYTVTGTPAGTCTVAAPATSCTVPALANNTAHAFTVVASNALWPSAASAPSTSVTPRVPVVDDPGPAHLPITSSGATVTVNDPYLPIVIGPGAGGSTIVLPGTGTAPVRLQIDINGQALQVQATPGSHLRIAQVEGQNVLVLVVVQGWASMSSSAVGQPLVLAGPVLLRSGQSNTTVEAIPLAVAVQVGSLAAPAGSLPQVGGMGMQAGERLQVNAQGDVVSVTLGSLRGDTAQPGDPMAFASLPRALTVDKAFARLSGPLARLSGADLAQGLEMAPSGVFLVRDGGQVFQLLPTLPIGIDATQPDGVGFTPLGLLRWVRGGVVVQFAPAVADLEGLARAMATALPAAQIRLGAEGVLQLRSAGQTHVLKPGWTGAGTATGTARMGLDPQGRISLQIGNGPGQLLLPSLLSTTQAQAIFQAAMPGAALVVQPGSDEGAFFITLGGQAWRLVPEHTLPGGSAAQAPQPAANWWMGADGLVYLRLGNQVQGVRIVD